MTDLTLSKILEIIDPKIAIPYLIERGEDPTKVAHRLYDKQMEYHQRDAIETAVKFNLGIELEKKL